MKERKILLILLLVLSTLCNKTIIEKNTNPSEDSMHYIVNRRWTTEPKSDNPVRWWMLRMPLVFLRLVLWMYRWFSISYLVCTLWMHYRMAHIRHRGEMCGVQSKWVLDMHPWWKLWTHFMWLVLRCQRWPDRWQMCLSLKPNLFWWVLLRVPCGIGGRQVLILFHSRLCYLWRRINM